MGLANVTGNFFCFFCLGAVLSLREGLAFRFCSLSLSVCVCVCVTFVIEGLDLGLITLVFGFKIFYLKNILFLEYYGGGFRFDNTGVWVLLHYCLGLVILVFRFSYTGV